MKQKIQFLEFKRRLIESENAYKYQPDSYIHKLFNEGHPLSLEGDGQNERVELDAPPEVLTKPQSAPPAAQRREIERLLEQLIAEVSLVRGQCEKTKWAVRAIGLMIAAILLFGFTFKIR